MCGGNARLILKVSFSGGNRFGGNRNARSDTHNDFVRRRRLKKKLDRREEKKERKKEKKATKANKAA